MTKSSDDSKDPEKAARNLEKKAKNFLCDVGTAGLNNGIKRQGAEKLAQKLISKSIDLQYSKATEFSSYIQKLALCAAKIAYLIYGPDSDEIKRYEKEVYYYRYLKNSDIAAEYDEFKRSASPFSN